MDRMTVENVNWTNTTGWCYHSFLLVNDNHLSRSGAGIQYQFPEYVSFWELACSTRKSRQVTTLHRLLTTHRTAHLDQIVLDRMESKPMFVCTTLTHNSNLELTAVAAYDWCINM